MDRKNGHPVFQVLDDFFFVWKHFLPASSHALGQTFFFLSILYALLWRHKKKGKQFYSFFVLFFRMFRQVALWSDSVFIQFRDCWLKRNRFSAECSAKIVSSIIQHCCEKLAQLSSLSRLHIAQTWANTKIKTKAGIKRGSQIEKTYWRLFFASLNGNNFHERTRKECLVVIYSLAGRLL